jgi:glycosyl transferase family 25
METYLESTPDIYYINLDHREDRRNHIMNQLKQINYPEHKIIRVSAIKTDFGGLGCGRSHIKALEHFLQTDKDRCIILEDDFTFYQNTEHYFHQCIVRQEGLPENWDLVMLSSNTMSESPFSDKFKKCNDAQTASGYMIRKKFAPTLLENFKESNSRLSSGDSYEIYAIDQYWKKLQPHSNWFICHPKVGYQMEFYSDISKCVVNHGC